MRPLILLIALVAATAAMNLRGEEPADTLKFEYKLHGQTRRFKCVFTPTEAGGLKLGWGIERNLKWWSGSYTMTPGAVERGSAMSFLMPEDGNHVTLPADMTFAMISRSALAELRRNGRFTYDGVEYVAGPDSRESPRGQLIHAVDTLEGGQMWVLDRDDCPIVWEMRSNPLEINWTVTPLH